MQIEHKTTERVEFLDAYIECALWSTNDESDERGGEPLDKNYDRDDLATGTLQSIGHDCRKFICQCRDMICDNYSQAGHDFWLTRNGHGAGFWDGDWPEHGDKLTKIADTFGEVYLYVGDDGPIYC